MYLIVVDSTFKMASYSYDNVSELFGVELKDKQKEILDAILLKQHTVAILPTGYGKSLPYQMYIPVMKDRQNETSTEEIQKVVVCCPLVALMQDQVNRLQGVAGLRVEYKGTEKVWNALDNAMYM